MSALNRHLSNVVCRVSDGDVGSVSGVDLEQPPRAMSSASARVPKRMPRLNFVMILA